MVVDIIYAALLGYFVLGLCVALVFVVWGAPRVATGAQGSRWPFRLMIYPGAVLLWPLALRAWRRAL